MKAIHTIVYSLLTLTTLSSLNAQEAAPANQLNAIVQFGRGKASIYAIDKVAPGDKFFFKNASKKAMEASLDKTITFQWQTPEAMAIAITNYNAGDMAGSRERMARVKQRYQAYQGFKMNPSSQAAIYELRAAIRMLDWDGVKTLTSDFKDVKSLEKIDQNFIKVASILANVSDSPAGAAAQLKAIKAFDNDKAKSEVLTLDAYGMLRYAEARAIASKITPDQFTRRVVDDALVADCSKAIDLYCQAAMAQRGQNIEFLSESLNRACILLSLMPGVRDYTVSLGSNPTMNAQKWTAGSANFRDAANIAFMLRKVLDYKKEDRAIDRVLATFYNPAMKAAK